MMQGNSYFGLLSLFGQWTRVCAFIAY